MKCKRLWPIWVLLVSGFLGTSVVPVIAVAQTCSGDKNNPSKTDCSIDLASGTPTPTYAYVNEGNKVSWDRGGADFSIRFKKKKCREDGPFGPDDFNKGKPQSPPLKLKQGKKSLHCKYVFTPVDGAEKGVSKNAHVIIIGGTHPQGTGGGEMK